MTPDDIINEVNSSIDNWTEKELKRFRTRIESTMNRPRLVVNLNHKVISYLGLTYVIPIGSPHDECNLQQYSDIVIDNRGKCIKNRWGPHHETIPSSQL